MTRPTELAITLAALPGRYTTGDGWSSADEIAHRLALLGFECSAQRVAAWLRRMSRVDAPWVEISDPGYWQERSYRVTRYGITDIENRLPGVTVHWRPA